MPVLDTELLKNIGIMAPVGAGGGVLIELLRRKMRNELGDLSIPQETAAMPMLDRPETPIKKKEKRSDAQLGHAIGLLGGTAGGMKVLGTLLNRKKSNQLDEALAQREAEFNQMLMQEQSLASGMPMGTLSALKAASVNKHIENMLIKIGSDLFDSFEKKGDIALVELINEAKKALNIANSPAYQAIAGMAALGGGLYGFNKMVELDPNQAASSTVRKALEERLTGKDKNMGPMPIRVESESPEMRPLKPGASSLVDPTKGRDVLEGI